MEFWIKLLVCFIAGAGAGLGTGFAGMSAAAVISPMLITFLGMDAYAAVGIALASDVLASAVSAYTYGKKKNLDIKNGSIMLISENSSGEYVPQFRIFVKKSSSIPRSCPHFTNNGISR